MELHFKYLDKVRVIDTEIEREKHRLKMRGEEMDEDMEDEFYIRRLDAGLFTLQLVDYVMLEISATGASTVSHSGPPVRTCGSHFKSVTSQCCPLCNALQARE